MQFSCPRHPTVEARYHCPRCGQDACGDCVKTISSGLNPVRQHVDCGGMVDDLGNLTQAAAAAARGIIIPLWQRLPEVFMYIGRRGVILTLLGLAVIRYLVGFIPIIGGWLGLALEAGVYFRIIETSAHGDSELTAPDFTSIDEMFEPLIRYLAAVAPIVGAFVWAGVSLFGGARLGTLEDLTGPLLLLAVGVLLLPLLLAIAALTRSVVQMYNPKVWVHTLRRFGVDYLLTVLLFYALLVAEQIAGVFLAFGLLLSPPIPILPIILAYFALYFPMALRGRLIGALCEPYMNYRRQTSPPPEARVVSQGATAAPPPPAPAPAPAPPADPTTDRELVAAARAAHKAGESRQVLAHVNRLLSEHPNSDLIPGALWLVAQAQEAEGRPDLAAKTLRRLVDNYPADPLADAARERLA